jgi:cytoskeletal protein CcmA (bactofilin family)
MVFRKESRSDSFQRQISALRQQLSVNEDEAEEVQDVDEPRQYTSINEPSSPIRYSGNVPSAPTMTPPRVSDSATGVIAANSTWSGNLRSEGSLQVFGVVDGELSAHDEIYVAEGARVTAHLTARTIIIAGSVDGTVECTARLEIMPSGYVSGDVTSPTLVVHEGARVDGDLKMQAPEGAA